MTEYRSPLLDRDNATFRMIDASRVRGDEARRQHALTQIEINELRAQEIIVETNSGTYSPQDAVRAIGTADPAYADYYVYERVGDGRRRHAGCDRNRAPGSARYINATELRQARRRITEFGA